MDQIRAELPATLCRAAAMVLRRTRRIGDGLSGEAAKALQQVVRMLQTLLETIQSHHAQTYQADAVAQAQGSDGPARPELPADFVPLLQELERLVDYELTEAGQVEDFESHEPEPAASLTEQGNTPAAPGPDSEQPEEELANSDLDELLGDVFMASPEGGPLNAWQQLERDQERIPQGSSERPPLAAEHASRITAHSEPHGSMPTEQALGGDESQATGELQAPSESAPQQPEAAGAPTDQASAEPGAVGIRIELAELDGLLERLTELSIAHNRLVRLPGVGNTQDTQLQQRLTQYERLTRQLQALSTQLNRFPIRELFRPLARELRELARSLGKPLDVSFRGESTELDRQALQQLATPLWYLARHAIAHSLEAPERRSELGKPERGQLALEAWQRGGYVFVEVSDDGSGFDRDAMRAKAQELEWIDQPEQITDAQADQLPLLPQCSPVSYSEDPSDLPLADLRAQLEDQRGFLKLRQEPGRFFAATLCVPPSQSVFRGFIVQAGQQRYVVPAESVREVVRPEPSQMSSLQGGIQLFRFRGTRVPLVRLSHFVGQPTPDVPDHRAVALVCALESQEPFGLLVDALLGEEGLVLKSLSLAHVPAVTGGAILSDGGVGVVIEPEQVYELASALAQSR
jgi:chemotaxis protein histidine kinase CheA